MAEITYLQAIKEGMQEELRRDERVYLLGEDIGVYGGAFKVTKGLWEEFGEDRVIDTPISESAIIGVAAGSAISGMRPVAEIQFADFITSGFSQIVTNVATLHYRHGIPVPMVIRTPSGGGIHGGPFHSKNPEAWFIHQPGLKVVAPATAYDAKGLLKSAIRDNNPVLYFEHKYLYRRVKDDVPEGEDVIVPIGKAAIRREGHDITVVTYGSTVHSCMDAAEEISKEGAEVEVIDLRSLLPFDKEAVLNSVRKTSRLVVVHEDTLLGGFGGEVVALVADEAFQYLDAPIKRVAALDTPTPYSPPLEDYFLPNSAKIKKSIEQVLAF